MVCLFWEWLWECILISWPLLFKRHFKNRDKIFILMLFVRVQHLQLTFLFQETSIDFFFNAKNRIREECIFIFYQRINAILHCTRSSLTDDLELLLLYFFSLWTVNISIGYQISLTLSLRSNHQFTMKLDCFFFKCFFMSCHRNVGLKCSIE